MPYGAEVTIIPFDAEGNLVIAAGRALNFVRTGLILPQPGADFVEAPRDDRGRITANSFLASYEFWRPTGPTLILVGDEDLRAPPAQGVEFYQALKLLKVPTALIRFHDEPHGFHVKPSNFLRSQAYMRSWFDRYKTKDEPGTL